MRTSSFISTYLLPPSSERTQREIRRELESLQQERDGNTRSSSTGRRPSVAAKRLSVDSYHPHLDRARGIRASLSRLFKALSVGASGEEHDGFEPRKLSKYDSNESLGDLTLDPKFATPLTSLADLRGERRRSREYPNLSIWTRSTWPDQVGDQGYRYGLSDLDLDRDMPSVATEKWSYYKPDAVRSEEHYVHSTLDDGRIKVVDYAYPVDWLPSEPARESFASTSSELIGLAF